MSRTPAKKSRLIQILVPAAILACSGVTVAGTPSASVDGAVAIYGGYSHNDPGKSSTTTAVGIAYDYQGVLSYSATAGGGSLSGGPNPFITISTYAYNTGAWLTQASANAGTWSFFYVGARPGFAPLAADTVIPIQVDYTSVLSEQFGDIRTGWNAPEPYHMAYFLDDVAWRDYNQTGSLLGSVHYGDQHSVGLYTSMESRTENVSGPGAWAQATLTASVIPYVDPTWNEQHGNGYQIYYVSLAPPVPEPASYALLLAGLGMLGWLAERRHQAA